MRVFRLEVMGIYLLTVIVSCMLHTDYPRIKEEAAGDCADGFLVILSKIY